MVYGPAHSGQPANSGTSWVRGEVAVPQCRIDKLDFFFYPILVVPAKTKLIFAVKSLNFAGV
jgi:hypothetical protein